MFSRSWTRALLPLLLCCTCTHAIWPFPAKKFSGNSMLNAGSLGITQGERVVAFGDFDGDQFLDVLVLDNDQRTLRVYLWDHKNFIYHQTASFAHPNKVYNVVPGDFTHSGKLDLLVMGSEGGSNAVLNMHLYMGLATGGFDTGNPLSLPSSSLSQPIPVDLDGDMKIDLLGYKDNTLMSWKNVWNESDADSALFSLQDSPLTNAKCTIANPHSNAVVDFDGDCLADIFLLCDNGRGSKTYQIWLNQKENGYTLAQQGSLPSGLQSITFADVDRDGTMDMVFTTCASVSTSTGLGTDCSINVAFNQQLPLCASSTEQETKKGVKVCRQPDNLCTADSSFKFDLSDTSENDSFMRIPFSKFFKSDYQLLVQDTTSNPALPVSLKLGDANLDGFPDILFIVSTPSHSRTPKILMSVPCDKGVVGCNDDGSGRRGWEVTKNGVLSLEVIKDARSVSFLDMDEDGTLDVMVQRTGKDGVGKVTFVQNNFYFDAFFLKAIVLNGACNNGWCDGGNGTGQYQPFGVSYSGATYKYTILDTSGKRAAAQVGQLPQTSYQSLQTPYSFFGLGRTNNYIENLFVGSTMHIAQHYINMEGVIPNSKVVILPSHNEAWKRELFLRPGNWIPWVTLTVVVGMALLALIVVVLRLNEKREDELERRRASHHINFDAL